MTREHSTPAARPVLEIRDLSISFPASEGSRIDAVRSLDLSLSPGSLTALVGESGSGKSVTAMSVLGLVPTPPARVETGTINYTDHSVDGLGMVDLLKAPPKLLRRIRGREIAMIFQEPMTSLNPVLTIGAQIVEAIRLHRRIRSSDAKRRACELLERVGIPRPAERFGQYPHEFSGGMRQRVMIAIALACAPKVLVADEPTTALDVTIQATILDLIRDLVRDEGLAVLLITHDLALVSEYADRIAVMYQGHLLEAGVADRILASPMHPYTRGLLATAPRIDAQSRDKSAAGSTPPARLATLENFTDAKAAPITDTNGASWRPFIPGSFRTGDGSIHGVSPDHASRSGSMVSVGPDHRVRTDTRLP